MDALFGLVDYSDSERDSENERQSLEGGLEETSGDQIGAMCSPPIESPPLARPGPVLPNAATLFGDDHSSGIQIPSSVLQLYGGKRRIQTSEASCPHPNKLPRTNDANGQVSLGPQPPPLRTKEKSMIPPQLRGRSNVATEDLSSMFTKRTRSSKGAKKTTGTGGQEAQPQLRPHR